MKFLISDSVISEKIVWKRHALQRMMERDISRSDVKRILLSGEIIEEYLEDRPFPSFLLVGFLDEQKPLHVVAAVDKNSGWCYIITAYHPDRFHFEEDFKTRRQ